MGVNCKTSCEKENREVEMKRLKTREKVVKLEEKAPERENKRNDESRRKPTHMQ